MLVRPLPVSYRIPRKLLPRNWVRYKCGTNALEQVTDTLVILIYCSLKRVYTLHSAANLGIDLRMRTAVNFRFYGNSRNKMAAVNTPANESGACLLVQPPLTSLQLSFTAAVDYLQHLIRHVG